jgi:DNA polymerase-3 subunit epsilon
MREGTRDRQRAVEERSIPDGMRERLGMLRAQGAPVPLVELARHLLALDGRPAEPIARRLVAGLLGARPDALPAELVARDLRPVEESAVAATPLDRARFTVVDVETTGLSADWDAIIEIGAVRVEALCTTSRFETLVRPPGPGPLSAAIVALTGIDEALLEPAPPAHRALAGFTRWLGEARGAPWVAHNARFDRAFLRRAFEGQGARAPAVAVFCTQRLARRLLPRLGRYDLDHVCAQFGVRNRARHRALGDADATAHVWIELLALAVQRGVETLGDLLDLQEQPVRRRKRRRR